MRLIIVSNRVALPGSQRKQVAGGLAVAVKAAMRHRTGVWFGWSGTVSDTPTRKPRFVQRNRVAYAVIDLSNTDFHEYYNGFANRVLWPFFTIELTCRNTRAPTKAAICGSTVSSPTS